MLAVLTGLRVEVREVLGLTHQVVHQEMVVEAQALTTQVLELEHLLKVETQD
jgi:hypothetical protein